MSVGDFLRKFGFLWKGSSEEKSLVDESPVSSQVDLLTVDWSSFSSLEERERITAHAMLRALADHFPSRFRKLQALRPEVAEIVRLPLTGAGIKLRRIAIAKFASEPYSGDHETA